MLLTIGEPVRLLLLVFVVILLGRPMSGRGTVGTGYPGCIRKDGTKGLDFVFLLTLLLPLILIL